MTSVNEVTERHVRRFFEKHEMVSRPPLPGPARQALPALQVLEIAPGPRLYRWTYVTVGAWEANVHNPFEYVVTGDEARLDYLALLTITAFYGIEHTLGIGHTIPIGRPLVPGSSCEHVYFSLPYVFGPELEVLTLDGRTHHLLWLFPITAGERQLLIAEGRDALEDRLESEGVEYWNPFRASVV